MARYSWWVSMTRPTPRFPQVAKVISWGSIQRVVDNLAIHDEIFAGGRR